MKGHSSSTRGADGIGVEVCRPYVVEAQRGMLFEQTDEMPLEAWGTWTEEFLPFLEIGHKDERCRREGGLSAYAQRHALSKWCRVIKIASEVSRLVMSFGR